MRHVLGINCSGFHASACLLGEEGIRVAICEERLSRVKQDRRFPLAAIEYCLDAGGLTMDDVSHAFIGWHPRFYLRHSDHSLLDAFKYRGKMAYLALNELATLSRAELTDITQSLFAGAQRLDIHFVDHHRAHAANAFFQSGFESADFLVLDGFGEVATGACGTLGRDDISVHAEFRTPHSLGSFYSAFTQFLGFRPNSDEWKVMALAALGDPARDYARVRRLITTHDLRLTLDLSFFEHFLFFTPDYFSTSFVEAFGEPLAAGELPSQRHADLAAAMQRVSEEVVFSLTRALQRKTGGQRLIVGGGYFMNSVCNGKLLAETPYRELFIGPAPDDSGIAVGSALHGAHYALGRPPVKLPVTGNYWGRDYTGEEVERELARRKIGHTALDDPAATGAGLIAAGKVIGWFQGRSEFGQRALGNRSVLANPAEAATRDVVNRCVKYRESFRPFAPSVLAERAGEMFEGSKSRSTSWSVCWCSSRRGANAWRRWCTSTVRDGCTAWTRVSIRCSTA